jgi:sorting nexin-41/42
MEQSWAEPLHEYAQFAEIIKKLLSYRHQKHVQYEMTKTALENKREVMDELERSEAEAQRLQSALSGSSIADQSGVPRRGTSLLSGDGAVVSGGSIVANQSSYSTPMRRKTSTGGGLLSALSYSIQGMMDVDPETARRNSMSKTKESITLVHYLDLFTISCPAYLFLSSRMRYKHLHKI